MTHAEQDLIKEWFYLKTGTKLMNDPSLNSLIKKINELRKNTVIVNNEGLCHYCNVNQIAFNNSCPKCWAELGW